MSMQDPNSTTGSSSDTWSGSMSGSTGSAAYGAHDPADKARQKAGEVMDQAQDKVGEVADKVKEQASSQISSQKDRAAEGLGNVADAIRQTGEQLRKNEQAAPVAQYTDQLAQGVEMVSNYLRSRSIPDIFNEVERFARREPALFLGGALTLGLLGGRFLRSSSTSSNQSQTYNPQSNMYGSGMYGYGYGTASTPRTGYGTANSQRTGYGASSDTAGYNSYDLPGSVGSEMSSQSYARAGSESYYGSATPGSTGSTGSMGSTGSSGSSGSARSTGSTGSTGSTDSTDYSSSYPTDSYGSTGSTGQSYGSRGSSAESGGPQGVV
jgi:hypothetical protein